MRTLMRRGCRGESGAKRECPSLLSRIGIVGRVGLILFTASLLPLAASLVLLEADLMHDPAAMLGMALALGLGLLAPISRLCASVIVLRDLRTLNQFCSEIREGRYGASLVVGPEGDDEHEMLRLKRNMNWMAHHIRSRTGSLRARLDESDQHKRYYEEMSFRDPLTGLRNRRYFEWFLSDLLRRPPRNQRIFLALVDCDRFKRVNDTRGHQAGDAVLACLGKVIGESVRESVDVGFRFGGDEFGVVFRDIDRSDCLNACDRIRRRFTQANAHGCTVSIGIGAWTPAMGSDPSALVRSCDALLYRAKGQGGDHVAAPWPAPPSSPVGRAAASSV